MNIRVGEYRQLLEKALPKKKQLLIVGPQGIGKTQVPEDLCKQWGWDCYALCCPMLDPSFLMGYPFRGQDGTADHLPFGVMAKVLQATRPTLLILDEIGGSSETMIKSALRFLQFREVGGKRLPDCVVILALSNDTHHGAGVLGITEPAKSRFDSIVYVEPHIDDTVTYGLAHNWPDWLLAYLRNAPDALYDYKPSKSMKIGGSDPRGWERVSDWDKDGFLDGDLAAPLVHGRVGQGRGSQALAFRELINQLPDVDGCILDPEGSPVPDNPSARFFVSMALASRMTADNFGQCVKYLKRLPAMFRAFSIRDAFRAEQAKRADKTLPKNWKQLASSRDFTAWATSEDGKDIMTAAG